jgi:hypothetical protein
MFGIPIAALKRHTVSTRFSWLRICQKDTEKILKKKPSKEGFNYCAWMHCNVVRASMRCTMETVKNFPSGSLLINLFWNDDDCIAGLARIACFARVAGGAINA